MVANYVASSLKRVWVIVSRSIKVKFIYSLLNTNIIKAKKLYNINI